MTRKNARRDATRPLTFITDYAEANVPESLVIPEDLSALSDEDLSALSDQARSAFNDMFGDGADLTPEDLLALEGLTEGIEALAAEQATRDAAAAERAEAAAALAARVNPPAPADETETVTDEAEETSEDEETSEEVTAEDTTPEVTAEEPAAIAASARRGEVRVNLSGLSRRAQTTAPAARSGAPTTMRDLVMAAPDVPGFTNGQGMDFADLGRAVDARLTTFNKASYDAAHSAGRHLRQQFGVATIRKPFEDGLRVLSTDPAHVDEVLSRAADETRLPGGSLVASGGWCAPSETIYDLFCEDESRDGLFSLPEINVTRGGIRWAQGPDFSSLLSEITGFHYTEAQDIAGTYGVDANGNGNGSAGSKPCYKVDCPDFIEARLEADGICITAGLLQRRGYPEYIARVIRGALVAHDHRIAGRKIAAVAAGSTAVTMPSPQAGAAAPLLTAIELQVEHYKQVRRLSRATTLEAVFPFWVRGAVRADLSRRLGVELLSVTDQQISGWFTARGVNPQFVYNWQELPAAATAATAYPSTVKFLLYSAGTWVAGGSDIITLDTLYDSTLLGQNDYTALFTEEGYLVVNRGCDSRVVTVSICPDGATAAGIAIECNGTEAAPVGG